VPSTEPTCSTYALYGAKGRVGALLALAEDNSVFGDATK
jgi:hypothetical protein